MKFLLCSAENSRPLTIFLIVYVKVQVPVNKDNKRFSIPVRIWSFLLTRD